MTINNTEGLFSDQRKFKIVNEDPTFRNLRTVQNYLSTLYNRGEITELEKKEMCPKFSQSVRAQGLTKIHKSYETVLKSNQQRNEINKEDNKIIIRLEFLYLVKKGDTLLTSLKQKVRICLKEDVKFITSYKTKKMAIFSSGKGKV